MSIRVLKSVTIIFFIIVIGCTGNNDDKKKLIFLSIGDIKSSHTVQIINDMQRFSEENGFLFMYRDSGKSLNKQIESIREVLKVNPEIIIISPVKNLGMDTIIKEAYSQGVKIIFLNSITKVNDTNMITAFVKADNVQEGVLAARGLSQYFQGRDGEIIEIQGVLGSSVTKDRGLGFRQELVKFDNLEILDVVQNCENRFSAYNSMLELVKINRNKISAVFTHNDILGLGVLDALLEVGLDIPIISIGGTEDCAKAILATCYYGTVKSENGVKYIYKVISEDKIDKKYYYLESKLYDKNTVSELISEN